MPQGLNCAGDIIRWIDRDDDVGGNMPTGTILHSNVMARIQEQPTDTMFLQQGLETKKILSGLLWGPNLQIREQDEFIVMSPPNHEYYGKRFRIIAHQSPNVHPGIKQKYHLVKLERSQISHREVSQ